jgi:aspartyl-tRNA(Asn)/glutamyl-tRNA(Gln) amidotransferase subunit B
LSACPREIERFRGGEAKLMGFFVGQVMKATKGQGNPKIINDLLREQLK